MSVQITYTVHGATADNEQHLMGGWRDSALTALGRQQAKELGDKLKEKGALFDAVISSDLPRAAETAEIAFGKGNFITDNRLREADYGQATGKPMSGYKHELDKYVDTPYPGGESYRDVEKRMRSLVGELKKNYDGQHVALVAHQAPQFALEVILNGKTWQQAIAEDWRPRGQWQPGWLYTL